MTTSSSYRVAVTLIALASLCLPAFAEDHPSTVACPASLTGGGGEVRLACACLPEGADSWWPLQGDAGDYCSARNGGIDETPGAGRSFSRLGVRQALDLEPGVFVNVPAAAGGRRGLEGANRLSVAVVVKTTKTTQPLVTKRVRGSKLRDAAEGYSFRLDGEYLYLDLYGETTGKKESCVSFKSHRRVKKRDLDRDGGVMLAATWSGFNRAAFYLDAEPLGADLIRSCKASVAELRATDSPLWLGASAKAGKDGLTPNFQKGFDGQMRDVVLYRRALESREVCHLAELLVPRGQSACGRSSDALVAASGGS